VKGDDRWVGEIEGVLMKRFFENLTSSQSKDTGRKTFDVMRANNNDIVLDNWEVHNIQFFMVSPDITHNQPVKNPHLRLEIGYIQTLSNNEFTEWVGHANPLKDTHLWRNVPVGRQDRILRDIAHREHEYRRALKQRDRIIAVDTLQNNIHNTGNSVYDPLMATSSYIRYQSGVPHHYTADTAIQKARLEFNKSLDHASQWFTGLYDWHKGQRLDQSIHQDMDKLKERFDHFIQAKKSEINS
jgi:hypothetical protein